jgi:hypothetical protein
MEKAIDAHGEAFNWSQATAGEHPFPLNSLNPSSTDVFRRTITRINQVLPEQC